MGDDEFTTITLSDGSEITVPNSLTTSRPRWTAVFDDDPPWTRSTWDYDTEPIFSFETVPYIAEPRRLNVTWSRETEQILNESFAQNLLNNAIEEIRNATKRKREEYRGNSRKPRYVRI